MGIVTKVKELFGFSPAEMVSYECDNCGGLFESSVPSEALVSCPECGGEEVTTLSTEK